MGVRPAVVPVGDLTGLRGAHIGDADELDAVHRRQHSGVRLPQMADADDRHP
jgi:hypothetical protein